MIDFSNNFFQLLSNSPWLLYGFSLALGLIVGSFLNVVIYRLPIMLEHEWREHCAEFTDQDSADTPTPHFNLLSPRSRCSHCQHPIAAWQNIPIISYILLKGRCANCGVRISSQYPLVELITGLLSVWVVMHFGVSTQALLALLLTWALIALSVIDLKHTLLPDSITLKFLWLGLLISLGGYFTSPTEAIIGAAAGYLSLWLVYQGFKLVTGKEGLGFGDFKLLAMLGAWLGWQALPGIILLSSMVGAIIGLSLIAFKGHDRQIPIPFGPYLAIAGWIYCLYGDTITAAYLNNTLP